MQTEKKVSVSDETAFMQEARDRFREAENGLEHVIDNAKIDLEMIDGEGQWEPKVLQFRENQGLSVVTENMFPSYINKVEGEFRQNLPQVDVVAVDNKADPATARILAGMIRNIQYQSQANMIHAEAFLMAVSSGFGAWRVHTDFQGPMSFNKEIVIRPIENHLAVRWDLTSKKFDTSDKKWTQIHGAMSKNAYKDKYPKADIVDFQQAKGTDYEGWFMSDGSVRICEYWYIKEQEKTILLLSNGEVIFKDDFDKAMFLSGGKLSVVDERKTEIPQVYTSIISGAGILEGPFKWPGIYIPIPICFGRKMNIQGKIRLKSLVRDARQTQRMHNYLKSSMVQSVVMQGKAPYMGTTAQFAGKQEEWKAALQGDLPFVTYNHDPNNPTMPQRQSPAMSSQGHSELLALNNAAMMDIIGMHQADLGIKSNEKSGKAILARAQQGSTGSFVFVDNFRHTMEFEGRITLDLVPKTYDTKQMVRIIGIDGKEGFAQLYEEGRSPNGMPIIKANPNVGKYDCRIKTGISYLTQKEQERDAMIEVMRSLGPGSPVVGLIVPEMIKTMDWSNSDNLYKAMIAMLPPNIQQIMTDSGEGSGKGGAEKAQLMQLQQVFEQKVTEMQQVMAKLDEENKRLKTGMQIELEKIRANVMMDEADKQLEREKIIAENLRQQKELDFKRWALIEDKKADMAKEAVMQMEKMAHDRHMKTEKREMESKENEQEPEENEAE